MPPSSRTHAIVAAAALVLSSCGIIGADYVPTEETFRKRVGTFIVDGASELTPSYGNVDVDSVIGSYLIPAGSNVDAVFEDIESRAVAAGWRQVRRKGDLVEFHKVTPGQIASMEIARVRAEGSRFIVGWLQVDGSETAEAAAQSAESKWAAKELWPRFEGR